jgi:DNA-binding response OmpR family regulator
MTSLLKKALRSSGFSVDIFNDSERALKNFKPHFYDLVILDIVMPKMDGFELYDNLKKRDSNVKVCFLTASFAQYYGDSHDGQYRFRVIGVKD